eukprot:gnl/TRDRNA2_/TRDRNA2_133652_c0_seq1.p1 gnl/TRDRNA2_/TRDRNA2_133652_c0~~gnl/TRDRNA2_/TRDRNA2_133652_c0_seq1.p1  ORF type:complete len:626 (+),score=86.81 gnl/TRDRNA2_/TRDRNA2_133652_c0_seq1:65-1879(+)
MSVIQSAQQKFLPRRFKWLTQMPMPRATSIMLQGIPPDLRSDRSLRNFFCDIFDQDQIVDVSIVKRTDKLVKMIAALREYEAMLQAEKYRWLTDGQDEMTRPTTRKHRLLKGDSLAEFGKLVDSIQYYKAIVAEVRAEAMEERDLILHTANEGTNTRVHSSVGFVTFNRPRERDIALLMNYKSDEDELVSEIPPDPSDVIYSDLSMVEGKKVSLGIVGYSLIITLLVCFMPLVGIISQIANIDKLKFQVEFVVTVITQYPRWHAAVEGVFSSLALTLLMGFLPTILMTIFTACFQLKAYAWAQHRLQAWYFSFLLFFVVLVTAVGGSLTGTFRQLFREPMKMADLLANSLPDASHFYLNYVIVQWSTHFLNLTRYMQLLKYMFFKQFFEDETAREKSEPEDQDYHGLGSRNASFSHIMCTAIIFCSLSPIICLLAFVNFAICRTTHGYLIVYAETRKPDLGGAFFVSMLVQIQVGVFIYIVLMAGVLWQRGSYYHIRGIAISPGFVAALSLTYFAYAVRRFRKLKWEALPVQEVVAAERYNEEKRSATRSSYVQPELLEELGAEHLPAYGSRTRTTLPSHSSQNVNHEDGIGQNAKDGFAQDDD